MIKLRKLRKLRKLGQLRQLRQLRFDTLGKELQAVKTTRGRKFRFTHKSDPYFFCVNPWLFDENSILESKAFRRLPDKTQVYSLPFNPHVRNRITHSFEVASTATTIASVLGLNIDLCRAAAFGHDAGHTPYGHAGERVLEISHALNGVIILQELERKGGGLNLTRETIEAILHHSSSEKGLWENQTNRRISNEAKVVKISDKISFIFSDFNDYQRMPEFLEDEEIPPEFFEFGSGKNAQRERIATCINATVEESLEKGAVSFSDSEVARKFVEITKWMYKLYLLTDRDCEKENIEIIVEYFSDNSDLCGNLHPNFVVSLMTDGEANFLSEILRRRTPTQEEINKLSLMEIIPSLNGKTIDHTKYDLW